MALDDHFERALDAFAERLRDEVSRQVRSVGGELAAAARSSQGPERPDESGAIRVSLAEAIRAIDAARTLTGVLEALLHGAAREAGRAAIFLARSDRFQVWRAAGFGPTFGEEAQAGIAREDTGIVRRAADTGSLTEGDHEGAPALVSLSSGQRCVAVPLLIGGKAVAVVYADSGAMEESALWNLDPVEIMSLHAARCLEALTAFKTARWLTDRAPRSEPKSVGAADRTDGGDEYAVARRYARLLVSEIKLYNEPQVAAGRRERDLATRLGGEIARAHALYEERVPANVRKNTDYVREELIRTLADGDESLL